MSRYIDAIPFAQAVSDLRNKEREEYDNLVGKHRSLARSIHGQHVEFCEKMLKAIREQPTVDAVPVVHAHWRMYSYDEAICSHCGYDRLTEFECTSEAKERWSELPKFCENCGARMDGAYGERRPDND